MSEAVSVTANQSPNVLNQQSTAEGVPFNYKLKMSAFRIYMFNFIPLLLKTIRKHYAVTKHINTKKPIKGARICLAFCYLPFEDILDIFLPLKLYFQ